MKSDKILGTISERIIIWN